MCACARICASVDLGLGKWRTSPCRSSVQRNHSSAMKSTAATAMQKKPCIKKPHFKKIQRKPAAVQMSKVWNFNLPLASPTDRLVTTRQGPRRGKNDQIRVGSDCSGWCTEHMAARKLFGQRVLNTFASDISKNVRTLAS